MANKFTLRGHGIEASYTIGGLQNLTALSYRDSSFSKNFTPGEVRTEPTELGHLISISLKLTIDSGGTTFSVFLPQIDVPRGQVVDFTTVAIYHEVSGPVVLPSHQRTTWRTVHLHGTAESVIVPLDQPAAS